MSIPELVRDKGQGPIGFTRSKPTTEGPLGLADKYEPKPRWLAQLNPVDDTEKPASRTRQPSELIPDLDKAVVDHILDLIKGKTKEESVVRLYSAIMHEHRHATQWQNPDKAKKLGKPGRELDAYLWEIENQKRTGLSSQSSAKLNVWQEVEDAWAEFKNSDEWTSLSEGERKAFVSRYESAKTASTK